MLQAAPAITLSWHILAQSSGVNLQGTAVGQQLLICPQGGSWRLCNCMAAAPWGWVLCETVCLTGFQWRQYPVPQRAWHEPCGKAAPTFSPRRDKAHCMFCPLLPGVLHSDPRKQMTGSRSIIQASQRPLRVQNNGLPTPNSYFQPNCYSPC